MPFLSFGRGGRRSTRFLETLNAADVVQTWSENETLGWVYQYFNSSEERSDMREESQAPRDARELAVRNQFLTPRYVVEFLVDNTLGRLWVEMTSGATLLTTRCVYLRAPSGFWPSRERKDPRDIRVIDPAFGSGHFLLYAFDLLATIYEEAWSLEPVRASDGSNLRDDFPNVQDFVAAVPSLVLRHNLFGVDVDARCAQIAQLALWMRGQTWLSQRKIASEFRAPIARINIIVAEPMPGEPDLRKGFIASLQPPALASLFSAICDRLTLAADLGVLLRLETDIRGLLERAEADTRQGTLFETSSHVAQGFWHEAESALLNQLKAYSEVTAGGAGTRKRLFAEDASHGVALVDLLQLRFDVALMNPPFGKGSIRSKDYFDSQYPNFKTDIGIAFVFRMLELLTSGGLLGAITSRNFLAVDTFKWFRQKVLLSRAPPAVLLDLGYGVLDAAMVEAAAYVLEPDRARSSVFYRALESREKEIAVREYFGGGTVRRDVSTWEHSIGEFGSVPLHVLCYWLPKSVLAKITSLPALAQSGAAARHGLQTTDDFRFLRLRWEVETSNPGRWVPIAKGGEYQPFWEDLTLTVDWGKGGEILKTFLADKRLRLQGSADWTPWLNHSEFYFEEGLTYPERTTSDFSPRVLPAGAAFSGTGIAIQFRERTHALAYLAGSYTRVFKMVTESFVGSGDNAFSGSAAKRYRSGLLNQIPAPLTHVDLSQCEEIRQCKSIYWSSAAMDETAATFAGSHIRAGGSLAESAADVVRWKMRGFARVLRNNLAVEIVVRDYYDFDERDGTVLDDLVGPHPELYCALPPERVNEAVSLFASDSEELMARAISALGARRQLTKKSFIADRRLELISHLMCVSASSLAEQLAVVAPPSRIDLECAAVDEVSFAIGVAFGRWHSNARPDLDRVISLEQIFAPPVSAASAGKKSSPILVDDEGHPRDILAAVRLALEERWGSQGDYVCAEIDELLCTAQGDLRDWIAHKFFDLHIHRYQDARRKAPVYLQIGCQSRRYSVWLYYPGIRQDTLFAVLQDCVIPKITHEERRLAELRGPSVDGSAAQQRKAILQQEEFLAELRGFAVDLRGAAAVWSPSPDDGTVVACAPLWKLFAGHRGWQTECQDMWFALENGELDWSGTALRLWPSRVVEKSLSDRSLALGHGIEEIFGEAPGSDRVTAAIRERTSHAIDSALGPAGNNGGRTGKRSRGRRGAQGSVAKGER